MSRFFDEPAREFHVREVARAVRKSPTTVSKELKGLVKEELLVSEKKRGHLLFKANSQDEAYKREKQRYNVDRLFESGLVEFLKKKYSSEAIGLFGSFAKAENDPRSDIDVFVISPVEKEGDLKEFEKKLGLPIQLFVFSRKKVDEMRMKNKELLNNLVNGIILDGYWRVFR